MTGLNSDRNAMYVASGFMLGMFAGLLLKDAVKQAYSRARMGSWRRGYDETVSYDQNLPEQLERREPAPRTGEPRFGGTGALGIHPERAL